MLSVSSISSMIWRQLRLLKQWLIGRSYHAFNETPSQGELYPSRVHHALGVLRGKSKP